MIEFHRIAPLLAAIGMAEADGQSLDAWRLDELSCDAERGGARLDAALAFVCAAGLAHVPKLGYSAPPVLFRAGRQYLAARGDVDNEVLGFLPHTVDDLNARRALLRAGALLVDEFRAALLAGETIEHARSLVPESARALISERVALDLYAAAIALLARLEAEQPAACVAEELVAVELVTHADAWLEAEVEHGLLSDADAAAARAELASVFGLFQSGITFDSKERADVPLASLAEQIVPGHALTAWFRPIAGAAATGYLTPP